MSCVQNYVKFFFSFSKDAPEAPAPPQVLTIRHESAIVSWSDPKDTGGSPITGFFFLPTVSNLFIAMCFGHVKLFTMF